MQKPVTHESELVFGFFRDLLSDFHILIGRKDIKTRSQFCAFETDCKDGDEEYAISFRHRSRFVAKEMPSVTGETS